MYVNILLRAIKYKNRFKFYLKNFEIGLWL